MIVKVSPREAVTVRELLLGESGLAYIKGRKLESDYLTALARKFEVEQ